MRLVQRLAFRLTRGCVDLVVANSRAGAEFHRRLHGHAESQYRVVYNGVDVERFRPLPRDEVRRELGFAPGDLVAGIFASFKPQKNHPLFFRAAARVAPSQPALRLLVVGDELAGGLVGSHDHKRQVAQLVDELGLRERCVFLGNRSDPERLYNACDVLVLPSYYEGTPNVLLEALACGVPALATDVGDNAHVLAHGRGGVVVPSEDEGRLAAELARLLGDSALRARLGAEARQRVAQNFSLQALGAEMGRVYEAGWAARMATAAPARAAAAAPR
jgi:glycosyltransferase involved in cell wall biosynthesis